MATKRSDGRWQEVVSVRGKRKYFYGQTRAEVKKKIYDYTLQLEQGPSFREAAEAWWEEAEPKVAISTARGYKPAMERAIEEFGETPCNDITPQDCFSFLSRFSKTHAQKTVNTQHMVMNHIFTYAVSHGMAKINPMRDIDKPQGKIPSLKRKTPPQEELERIKAAYGCPFGMFAFMAVYTGMRRGELLALRWEDVDLEAREIHVKHSVCFKSSSKPVLKEPKTETSLATVPIFDALYERLKPVAKKHGLVFPNEKGGLMCEWQYDSAWKQYQKEAGVTFTVHQLRHAYATILFENGVAPEEMQILLRHAQLSTTMDIYREIRQDQQKRIHAKYLHVDF